MLGRNILSLFLLVVMALPSAFAQSQSPAPSPWPDTFFSRISRDLSDDWADQTTRLSASLFDSIADFSLFTAGSDSVEVSPQIRRQVFDNRDLLETYTVADTFRLPIKIGLWENEEIPFPGATLSAGFGIELFFQGLNIRQVGGDQISELEAPPEDIENRLRNLRRARYGEIWNSLMIPLRLPLTEKAFERMQTGEISSWLLGGTLRLDGSFGWGDLGVLGADFLEINTGFTTYLSGTFRVSAFKLGQKQVRLKVSRERNAGLSIGLGQSRMEYTLFEGFMVFDKNVLDIQESIVPFSFQTSWEIAKGFDVAYDYDLNKPEAKRAYFLATQGRLEVSNRMAEEVDSGVKHVISRDFQSRRHLRRSQIKLSLLFQKQSAESWSLTQAHITTPEAAYTVFESQNINVRSFDTLWGSREERRYQLTAALEEDGSWIKRDRVLDIQMYAKDSDMTGKELNQLLNEAHELSGIDLELPDFPEKVPCRRCSTEERSNTAWYGPGSASVQIEMPGKDLAKLLVTPKEEYWPLLESAHGVANGEWSMRTDRFWWTLERLVLTTGNLPLFLIDVHMKPGGRLWNAWRVRRHWRLAAKNFENQNQFKLARRLGKLFKQRYYNRELTRLVIMAGAPDENVPTIVDINAPEAFGRIRKVSGEFPPDDLSRRLRRELDFDRPGPRQDFDPDMTFKEAKVERRDDESIVITFTLEKIAHYLHWHIEKRQSFGRRSTIMRRMMTNLEVGMGPGETSITLRKDETDPLLKRLYESLNQPIPVAIRIAASQDGESWGEITELHLDAPDED